MSDGGVLVSLDDQPARVARGIQNRQHRSVIDRAIAGHGEHPREHRLEEAPIGVEDLREDVRAHVLAVHVDQRRA